MQVSIDTSKAETNSQFTRQHFSVADMSIIMNLLSKLYSKPIQTLVQEYVSNARDATREAKSKRKIEIKSPTRFEPTFSVRDYGPGLDPERIKTVFLLYGASTKRDSNTQTGGFGIGAKSAWAYTDSFTIVSFVNGTKRTYVAHKSDGNGNLDLISTEPTKEGNGTEIQIAVKPNDITTFRQACNRVVLFWNESEAPILKGIAASEIEKLSDPFSIDSTFTIYPTLPDCCNTQYGSRVLLSIDGIPYLLFRDICSNLVSEIGYKVKGTVVIHLTNSDVKIAPNREELIYDDSTINSLTQILTEIKSKIVKYVDGELNKCPSLRDLIAALKPLVKHFKIDNTYHGYKIYNERIELKTDYVNSKYISPMTLSQYTRGKLRKCDVDQLWLSGLDNIYHKDIAESKSKNGMRIRNFCQTSKQDLYLLNEEHADYSKMVTDFGAKGTSSLVLPAIQRNTKGAPVTKLDFCVHGLYSGPKQVNMAAMTGKYIYDSYTNPVYSVDDLSYINKVSGLEVFRIADSYLPLIKAQANFISAETYLDTFEIADKDVLKYIANSFSRTLPFLRNFTNELLDKNLVNFIEMMPKDGYTNNLPDIIVNSKLNAKKFKEMEALSKSIENKIYDMYPFFEHFNDYTLKKTKIVKELISYMNFKYKLSKKVNKVKP